jgi:16S rRNA (guanine(1405)-N(7))-methyltransferase
MSAEVVERVRRSSRYRDVDERMLERLAGEELARSRTVDEAVKRVKRRLHQAVGAFRGSIVRDAGAAGDRAALRERALAAMRRHASTSERVPYLDRFHAAIWEHTGLPASVLDLGCGLHPLSVPWMRIGDAPYAALDVDGRALETVRGFLGGWGQPHRVEARDLVADPATERADVALLLKLVTTLDRQDAAAADRVLARLEARHAVVSFAARSLAGRGGARETTYRQRLDRLVAASDRVRAVAEASIPTELVFVLTLEPRRG